VDYHKHISVDPAIRSGKPCVIGTRITVYDVLSYLAAGMTPKQVLVEFPQLTEQSIQACLAFTADHERRLTST
jgi:uncharacterized protein (DUF433 family)